MKKKILKYYFKIKRKHQRQQTIRTIEKQAGLRNSMCQIVMQNFKIYKQRKKAYAIGKRAGLGYNVYLTFGSDKTVTKNAKESYKRYSMAMKHYGQVLCDVNSFIQGYNKAKV